MELYEAIKKRYSVRAYQDKPVEQEKLDRIFEAVRQAPSANNRQPWKFVIVREAGIRGKLVGACHDQAFVGEAAVVIAGVGLAPDRTMACGVPSDPVDLGIAMEHIALAAVDEGLGTCWIGSFDQDQIHELLGIPAEATVIEVMTLGYPAGEPKYHDRKGMDEIVSYEKF
ncbi:MAG: nitroreductase family protein [Phycisphaerae bacterium]|nr:nitroreductase family protein [Phycisphaerae bacterium]